MLRPDGMPASALKDLLSKGGDGLVMTTSARLRLLNLGYIRHLGGWMCRLTPDGLTAARALQASS